ncbi:MAG: hypothetical protein Q9163_005528 [Psora crenata]
MLYSLNILASAVALASAAVVPRQASNGQSQTVPASAPPDGSFNNGTPKFNGMPPESAPSADNTGIYGSRDIDLPFNRLHKGNLMFFPQGQLNSPNTTTDLWVNEGGVDSATQSACGIPDNAFTTSKVAIHPYFLKYADLSRYCMQDVCISFWQEDWKVDMMLKVTDICSTDPNDPTHCATPNDIKIDRSKAKVWSGHGNDPLEAVPDVLGNSFPQKAVWFFVKCWADGTVQEAYKDNWFAQPPLVNNQKWSGDTSFDQYNKNQISYAKKGWPTYENGGYNPNCQPVSLTDWVPGQEPGYTPIAGGQGFGRGGGSGASPAGAPAAGVPSASPASDSGASGPPAGAPSASPASDSGASGPPAGAPSASPASDSGAGAPPAGASGAFNASNTGAGATLTAAAGPIATDTGASTPAITSGSASGQEGVAGETPSTTQPEPTSGPPNEQAAPTDPPPVYQKFKEPNTASEDADSHCSASDAEVDDDGEDDDGEDDDGEDDDDGEVDNGECDAEVDDDGEDDDGEDDDDGEVDNGECDADQ